MKRHARRLLTIALLAALGILTSCAGAGLGMMRPGDYRPHDMPIFEPGESMIDAENGGR